VYGPYFFENPANSNNVRTVTTVAYIDLLQTEFSGSNPPEVWFQQDGATSHTSSRAIIIIIMVLFYLFSRFYAVSKEISIR